jgi:hypothetical protein
MAKKKKRLGGSRSKKLPLAVAVPLAIPIIAAGRAALSGGSADDITYKLMGFNAGGVDMAKVAQIGVPIVGGVLVHKFVGRAVNRYIPKWLPVSI